MDDIVFVQVLHGKEDLVEKELRCLLSQIALLLNEVKKLPSTDAGTRRQGECELREEKKKKKKKKKLKEPYSSRTMYTVLEVSITSWILTMPGYTEQKGASQFITSIPKERGGRT